MLNIPGKQFYVNLDRCTNCRACEVACHEENGFRGVRVLTVGPRKCLFVPIFTEECTSCKHLVDRGLEPPCAATCFTKAIRFGDKAEIAKILEKPRLYGTAYSY